ncbi:MAG: hypothetical protein PHC41_07560 [Lachnospiraceae bacterium]|nr:hypothetical protein [Lachnospiraceae bacterium]MDD3616070.1 hypothetical protein [Lachnospiraceae bacterium]
MKQNNVKQHLKSRTREEIISILTATEDTSKIWHVLSKQSKEHIISIYSLQNVLKLTYDRVFALSLIRKFIRCGLLDF